MNCQHVADWLDEQGPEFEFSSVKTTLGEHLETCEECRHAWSACRLLGGLMHLPDAEPRPGLFEAALAHASGASTDAVRRRSFWLGTGTGVAIAASIVVAALALTTLVRIDTPLATPGTRTAALTFALHEARDVDLAITAAEALSAANLRVSLPAGLELAGFPGQREIRWQTDLEAGINRLRLPIAALAAGAGQLLVEVEHGRKHQSFVVEIAVEAAELGAYQPEGRGEIDSPGRLWGAPRARFSQMGETNGPRGTC